MGLGAEDWDDCSSLHFHPIFSVEFGEVPIRHDDYLFLLLPEYNNQYPFSSFQWPLRKVQRIE